MFEILEKIGNFVIVVGFPVIVILIFRIQKKQLDALREGSNAEIRGLKQEIKILDRDIEFYKSDSISELKKKMIELKTSYEGLLKEKGEKNVEMENKIKELNKDLKKLHSEIEIRDKFERGEYGSTSLEDVNI